MKGDQILLGESMALRPATENDWPAVAALLDANRLPLDGAHEHLATYLVATSNGAIIGCAGAEIYGDVALLRSVAVTPPMQRLGVGKQLISRLLEEVKARNVARVYSLTLTAAAYFADLGFQRESNAHAPPALKASAEFRGACPASAVFMSLTLPTAPC
jgi:N-acetylglutamate synthase-like GNAT family acetyltransferase